jgi:hypothetical protein
MRVAIKRRKKKVKSHLTLMGRMIKMKYQASKIRWRALILNNSPLQANQNLKKRRDISLKLHKSLKKKSKQLKEVSALYSPRMTKMLHCLLLPNKALRFLFTNKAKLVFRYIPLTQAQRIITPKSN